MERFGLRFHHLGLAVKQEAQAISFLRGMGYAIGERILDPEQNVHLRMCCTVDAPDFELITPAGKDGPLESIFKRHDEMIYHSCYESANFGASVGAISAAGLRVMPIGKAKPAPLFDGRSVAFFQVVGFGLVEFLEC